MRKLITWLQIFYITYIQKVEGKELYEKIEEIQMEEGELTFLLLGRIFTLSCYDEIYIKLIDDFEENFYEPNYTPATYLQPAEGSLLDWGSQFEIFCNENENEYQKLYILNNQKRWNYLGQ
jgi:hypothetical protein